MVRSNSSLVWFNSCVNVDGLVGRLDVHSSELSHFPPESDTYRMDLFKQIVDLLLVDRPLGLI